MDTSEEYIKMCDCKEIQIQHKQDDDHEYSISYRDNNIWISHEGNFTYRADIWIPRQSQIQEMMPKCSCLTWEERTYCLSKRFWEFTEGHQQEEEYLTMEQLWLAFYMLEKHSKFWNGDKWIKSETE